VKARGGLGQGSLERDSCPRPDTKIVKKKEGGGNAKATRLNRSARRGETWQEKTKNYRASKEGGGALIRRTLPYFTLLQRNSEERPTCKKEWRAGGKRGTTVASRALGRRRRSNKDGTFRGKNLRKEKGRKEPVPTFS